MAGSRNGRGAGLLDAMSGLAGVLEPGAGGALYGLPAALRPVACAP